MNNFLTDLLSKVSEYTTPTDHSKLPQHVERNPVLLIHGIDDTDIIFYRMRSHLRDLGWVVYSIDLVPSNGDVGLDELAQQVAAYVERTFPPGQSIDLIGFSMGGIVSRYYVQRLGGINRVQRFITIASPHQGTWTAYLRSNPGCLQMRHGSAFLNDLNQDIEMLERINFTSIWSPMDLMIVPAHSSRITVGKEVLLQVLFHAWLVTDRACLKTIVKVLSEPIRSSLPLEQTLIPQILPQS